MCCWVPCCLRMPGCYAYSGGWGGEASFLYPARGRPYCSAASPFLEMPGYYAFQWVGRGGMFCISGHLKIYQGIKVEWIGSFAQPDIGNLPHLLTQEICVFDGPDIGNLPHPLTHPISVFAWPDMPNMPHPLTQSQFRVSTGSTSGTCPPAPQEAH